RGSRGTRGRTGPPSSGHLQVAQRRRGREPVRGQLAEERDEPRLVPLRERVVESLEIGEAVGERHAGGGVRVGGECREVCKPPRPRREQRGVQQPHGGGTGLAARTWGLAHLPALDRKSTRLNSSHVAISYAVFC